MTEKKWRNENEDAPREIRDRVRDLAARAMASGCPDVFLGLNLLAELAQDLLVMVESAGPGVRELTETPAALEGDAGGGRASAGVVTPSREASRMFSAQGRAVPSCVGLLALLEEFLDISEPPGERTEDGHAREGWRCLVPGCTSGRRHEFDPSNM